MEQKPKRLSRIDLLRGWFLVIVIVDHLGRYPGIFDAFTGRGLLWSSAAEGFFFLSGMMVGLIYGRKKLAEKFITITTKLWSRAAKLYALCVATTMLYTTIALLLAGHPGLKGGGVGSETFSHALNLALHLQFTYGWADFLQFYAVFMVLAPLAVWLLRKQLWPLVLATSLYFWWYSAGNMYFSWQLLFFGGTVYGFYMQAIERRFLELGTIWQKLVAGVVVGLATLSYAASSVLLFGKLFLAARPGLSSFIHVSPDSIQNINNVIGRYFDKAALPAERVGVFLLWFFALYLIVSRYETQISRVLGWLLVPLGRSSLSVYVAHSFIVFIVPMILMPSTSIVLNFFIDSVVIMGLWGLVAQRPWIARHIWQPVARLMPVSA